MTIREFLFYGTGILLLIILFIVGLDKPIENKVSYLVCVFVCYIAVCKEFKNDN